MQRYLVNEGGGGGGWVGGGGLEHPLSGHVVYAKDHSDKPINR